MGRKPKSLPPATTDQLPEEQEAALLSPEAVSLLNAFRELASLGDDGIAQEVDAKDVSRSLYLTSLIRLKEYLQLRPGSMTQAQAQASLSLGYIRHAEGRNLALLDLGRTAKDQALIKEVEVLRREIAAQAEARAALNNRAADRVVPPPPREEVALQVAKEKEAAGVPRES